MELPVRTSECTITNDGPVCSGREIVHAISNRLQIANAEESDDTEFIVDKAKELTNCASESCVIRKVFSRNDGDKILAKYFKPFGPRKPPTFFDNFNIDETLAQYAKKYHGFYNVPFQMIDFLERGTDLAKIDPLSIISAGHNTIGCVINTDVSSGRGIHWFSVFCDFRTSGTVSDPYTVEYFNSSGRPPMTSVQIWGNQIKLLIDTKSSKRCNFVDVSHGNRQQYDEHSCGPYSIYYIWSRLNNVPYKWFFTGKITDKRMHQFRKHIFREVE